MQKLSVSIPSSNVKIIELYNKIKLGSLDTSPDFQRKLVWKKQHKFHFIETILQNYPFPEIFIASKDIDVESLSAAEIVVDGQQRLTTIVDYIDSNGDFAGQCKLQKFTDLDTESKKDFLNYYVTVRDLKDLEIDKIKDIFKRINSTEYSLNTIEKINAQYGDSEFVIFAKLLLNNELSIDDCNTSIIIDDDSRQTIISFFKNNNIFSDNDDSRMMSLQYMLTLISTIIDEEYFHRNSRSDKYMELYNEEFPKDICDDIVRKLLLAIKVIDEMKLPDKSYWFNKTNVFTLLVELIKLEQPPTIVLLKEKLLDIEEQSKQYWLSDTNEDNHVYYKYFENAKEAVNDSKSRQIRGKIIADILANSAC